MMKLFEMFADNGAIGEDSIVSTRNVRFGAVLICVVAELIGMFFISFLDMALGLFLGGVIAQLLFRQHEIGISKMMESQNPKGIAVSNYFIRLLIRGAAIFIAIKNPNVSITGCVVGLLSVPYAIYILAFIDGIKNKNSGKEV